MPKLHIMTNNDETEIVYVFFCPGCKNSHPVRVKAANVTAPCWGWNGSLDSPTFTPSLLCNQSYPESRCHSFITDGNIQFLGDCWHLLKNQTVEIPEWE